MPAESTPTGVLGHTDQPLAAVYDVALLDLDGVVYVGPNAVPYAAESLDAARAAHGMRSAFVTNNAARPPAVVAEHLTQLGVHAAPEDVVISAQAGARVLAERLPAGSRVLAVGGPGVAWAIEERGMLPVTSADDQPAGILQGYGPNVGWRQLAEACLAIGAGALWVATNLDRTIPSPRGRVLGNGALVMAVQHATGGTPLVAGKPEPPLMLESVERTAAVTPLVVGDRLDTDIEGANRSGLPSLLVFTGVTDWPDLIGVSAELRPTYLASDLSGLLAPAPTVTVGGDRAQVVARCGRTEVTVPIGSGPLEPAADWWRPDELRGAGDAAEVDLDVVRAVVAAAWRVADLGATAEGRAQLGFTP